jgi:dehydrogenase/reductase SDR family protein 12
MPPLDLMAPFGRLLDATVVFSFDRTGFRRHAARFRAEDLEVSLAGKRCLVTGGNSGIGKAAAAGLAGRGAEVVLLCRSRERGEAAAAEIRRATGNEAVRAEEVDVSETDSIRAFVRRFRSRRVDVLVNNAGVLPDRRAATADGVELTLATNLLGPYLLTELLLPRLEASPDARVVSVASGGMYTQRLDVEALLSGGPDPFDGVVQYARTKRALVVLNEQWAARHRTTGVTFSAMHPGWADTPAVRTSLPRFREVTKRILRTPEEGADTVIWLAAAPSAAGRNGLFWFDREPVSTHYLPWTRETPEEREALASALRTLAAT